MAYKIAYDAGHGMETSGKRTPDGEREWSFNNKVVLAFEKEIRKYENVQLLRTDDPTGKVDVALTQRTGKANSWGANVYISFHHNANTSKWGTWTGVQTHVYTSKPAKSMELAKLVQPALVRAYGLRDRGIIANNLFITRTAKMPSILIEGGFMDSTIDIKKLRDDKVLANAGAEIARAVAKFGGLKLKAVEKPKPITPQQPVVDVNKPSTWAKKDWDEAIANGYFDGSRPKANITREEFAVTINKLHKNFSKVIGVEIKNKEGVGTMTENLASSWAKKDWEEAVANGYFDGSKPQENMTREQVAIVINRLRHNVKSALEKSGR